jgi:sn-glycerol 3-phosphate transport system permease protein
MSGKKLTKKTAGCLQYIGKVLLGLLFISPIIICVLFSIQPNAEVGSAPLHIFTNHPTLDNYIYVLKNMPVLRYLGNTLLMCVICILFQTVFASLAAYAFVFFEFPGKKLLFTAILTTMMIPGDVVIITNYVTIQNLGMVDTVAGLVITSLVTGTSIFMMRQYYMTLPKDLKEAATIDGCGDMRFLFSIAMPLSIPTAAALAINSFIHVYNAYFWPLLVTSSKEMRTVQIGMADLITGDSLNYGNVLAGAVLCMVPPMVAFIIGQDYIIKGMTAGAVKG